MVRVVESQVDFVEVYDGKWIYYADGKYFADIPVYREFEDPIFSTKRFYADNLDEIKYKIDTERQNYRKVLSRFD